MTLSSQHLCLILFISQTVIDLISFLSIGIILSYPWNSNLCPFVLSVFFLGLSQFIVFVTEFSLSIFDYYVHQLLAFLESSWICTRILTNDSVSWSIFFYWILSRTIGDVIGSRWFIKNLMIPMMTLVHSDAKFCSDIGLRFKLRSIVLLLFRSDWWLWDSFSFWWLGLQSICDGGSEASKLFSRCDSFRSFVMIFSDLIIPT